MKKIFKDNRAVLIKTYCFESGLWYLAKSLGDLLEEQGHKVLYIPKSKYQLMSASFRRSYPEPYHPDDFSDVEILNMHSKETIDRQILKHIVKHDVGYLISFETLMQKANWIPLLQRRFYGKLKVIDVPMAEWVEERYLVARSYRLFDEIWALNKLTSDIFSEYDNVKNISWDFIDKEVFNKEDREKGSDDINFLHLSSTNPDYSSKNTAEVIRAFTRFIESEKPEGKCHLYIQGAVPKKCNIVVEKHRNMTVNSGIVSRKELAELYKKSECIVAPSSREGLSLALYEGLASGCKVLTTDAAPMNYIKTPYLCTITNKKRDKSLVPLVVIDEKSLYDNFKRVYEDIKNGNK